MTLIRSRLRRFALLLVASIASACSGIERANDSKLSVDTPVEWWHDLQGGKIANVRPPPPGVTDPYPNLGQVPPRPVLTDAATRRALAARLAGERDRTQREATQDPLVLPATAAAAASRSPTFSAAPRPAVPADPGASVAVMDAATAPAPIAPPTPEAPRPAIAPTIAAAPGVPQAAGPAAEALRAAKPAVETGPLPELPTGAPPLPRLGGLPGSVDAPAVPRVPPGVSVAFPPGSATLPAAAEKALRDLAGRRGGATIAVTGGGAGGNSAEAQARALPLALRRGQAIGDALAAAGVPAAAIRVEAAATGRGGEARLLQ